MKKSSGLHHRNAMDELEKKMFEMEMQRLNSYLVAVALDEESGFSYAVTENMGDGNETTWFYEWAMKKAKERVVEIMIELRKHGND